ncbi:TBC1 domain family member 21 isoform X4 [Homo sapiens]|uniref:TBC1 domain family member 21 isoform X4 n=1 Tax=Homo sapiens TaxID=9606 RepID=UPI0005D0330B|nr:TBC1 domain family member 21 isoform X4 [Homo sapiens]XP_054233351.1 TBC1 domain family member 21 isoform X4 [Homo sapiens]|eukprot:XP_011519584.1 TBC1 domain family member 21 isoform X4 [Homo sapiens]
MTTLSPENSLSARQSASFILVKRKPPIDKTEWDSFFDESGHLAKSRDFICVNILERGLHPFVRTEAWKFLTGYFSWQSSQDERLTVDSMRRKNYKALCQMYEKIQPLLENLHRNFTETRNNIARDIQKIYDKDPLGNVLIDKKRLEKILLLSYVCNTQAEYQQGFHEMMMLFQLMVEHDHETFWLFQFFLQKTEHSCVINIGVAKNLDMLSTLITFLDPVFAEHLKGKGAGAVQSLFPWFCFCFQRAFKSFDDVWRLWEVLLTGKPCRNFQVLVAYSMLQMVREQVLQESMGGDDILLACNNLIDLDADELISAACVVYAELIQKDGEMWMHCRIPQ